MIKVLQFLMTKTQGISNHYINLRVNSTVLVSASYTQAYNSTILVMKIFPVSGVSSSISIKGFKQNISKLEYLRECVIKWYIVQDILISGIQRSACDNKR